MRSFTVDPRPPVYLSLSEEQWNKKIQKARELGSPCLLCPRPVSYTHLPDTVELIDASQWFICGDFDTVLSSFGRGQGCCWCSATTMFWGGSLGLRWSLSLIHI